MTKHIRAKIPPGQPLPKDHPEYVQMLLDIMAEDAELMIQMDREIKQLRHENTKLRNRLMKRRRSNAR